MNKMQILSAFVCISVFLVTPAVAEILGVQPGTSANPKDNVPAKVQRDGGAFGPGDSGPGQRDDALVGMKKEKPQPVSKQQLETNAEQTQGGGAALAAEDLKEKSLHASKTQKKSMHSETTGRNDSGSGGAKTDRQMFRQQNSDKTTQGQQLINDQPQETQQPANRPASERGARSK